MALRSALAQLAESAGIGILGLNRSCWGASTSSSPQQTASIGLRLIHSFLDNKRNAILLPSSADQREPPTARDGVWPRGWLGESQRFGIALRGYKSNKRPLKPLNTAASRQAVQPLIVQQRDREELLRKGPLSSRRWRPRLGPIVDTCLPHIPESPVPEEYSRVGIITGQYSLKSERVFAVIQIGGTQFKVTTDDIIFVNLLSRVEVNDVLALDRVMLLGSRSQTVVGRPYVPGATVLAAVEEHFRDGKVHVFKKKRRKRYRRYQAPRPKLTTLRILQVRGIDPAPGDELALIPEIPIQPLHPRYESLLGLPAPNEDVDDEEEALQQQQIAATATV